MSLSGSQGKVRFVTMKCGKKAVKKRAKNVDYTMELEAEALKRIAARENVSLARHYAKLLSMKTVSRKKGKRKLLELTMEKIPTDTDLHSWVRKRCRSRHPKAVESVLAIAFTTLCACELLRLECGIVHNDLHTSNVLVVRTADEYSEYDLNGKLYRVKTYGYAPVIVDFGYAYLPDANMLAPALCMDCGYSTDEPDPLTDARILLVKIGNAIRKYARVDEPILRAIDGIFDPLGLDASGRFPDDHFESAVDALLDAVYDRVSTADSSVLFNDETTEAEDLMCLFISNMRPPTLNGDPCVVEDEEAAIENAAAAFASFKRHALRAPEFCSVGPAKQLAMIKNWLNASDEETNRVVEAFRPIVYAVIDRNRALKRREYGKLSVSCTVDVLDSLYPFVR